MANAELISGARPREESLFRAVQELEQAIAAPNGGEEWYAHVRAALRRCILAVETRLDSLIGPGGMEAQITRNEPRLIPALDKLEAALASLLVEFWETKGQPSSIATAGIGRLEDLLRQVREIAGNEYMLVHEAFNAPGGEE